MNESLVWVLGMSALGLFVLLNDAARKILALIILAGLAFSVGWFWPKSSNDLFISNKSGACTSSF